MSDEEPEKYGGLYTQWNSVTDQIYVVHYSFVDRMSELNGFQGSRHDKRTQFALIGAKRDLYKLYRLCVPAKAFPTKEDYSEDRKKMLELCTSSKLPKVEELNWAANKITEWFCETNFLSVSVPTRKRFGKKNAMAEWHGTGY